MVHLRSSEDLINKIDVEVILKQVNGSRLMTIDLYLKLVLELSSLYALSIYIQLHI